MAHKPEIIPISYTYTSGNRTHTYETMLYRGVRKHGFRSDFNELVVLAHGWLGSGTLRFAARALAQRGHDVAIVAHGKRSIFHPNSDRSRNVHLATKAGTMATKKREVILVGHSNGNQDVHHAAEKALERQKAEPDNKELYIVKAIGSLAGVGLSGRIANGRELHRESKAVAREFAAHPVEELSVLGQSAANFAREPVLSLVEMVSAATCDVRPIAKELVLESGLRAFSETYMKDDGVIRPPTDRTDYASHDGSHMTPLVDGDMISEAVESLYRYNNPARLQIARHHR